MQTCVLEGRFSLRQMRWWMKRVGRYAPCNGDENPEKRSTCPSYVKVLISMQSDIQNS